MVNSATYREEYYGWHYPHLVEVLGEEKAKEKVALYQSSPFLRNQVVADCPLLKTYRATINLTGEEIPGYKSESIVLTAPPEMDSEDCYDPTDKGISRWTWQDEIIAKPKKTEARGKGKINE